MRQVPRSRQRQMVRQTTQLATVPRPQPRLRRPWLPRHPRRHLPPGRHPPLAPRPPPPPPSPARRRRSRRRTAPRGTTRRQGAPAGWPTAAEAAARLGPRRRSARGAAGAGGLAPCTATAAARRASTHLPPPSAQRRLPPLVRGTRACPVHVHTSTRQPRRGGERGPRCRPTRCARRTLMLLGSTAPSEAGFAAAAGADAASPSPTSYSLSMGTLSRDMSTTSGLMSQCTMLWSCRYARPAKICAEGTVVRQHTGPGARHKPTPRSRASGPPPHLARHVLLLLQRRRLHAHPPTQVVPPRGQLQHRRHVRRLVAAHHGARPQHVRVPEPCQHRQLSLERGRGHGSVDDKGLQHALAAVGGGLVHRELRRSVAVARLQREQPAIAR